MEKATKLGKGGAHKEGEGRDNRKVNVSRGRTMGAHKGDKEVSVGDG